MKLLVIGRNGQVARALAAQAAARGFELMTLARPEFDLEQPALGRIAEARPDVVINAGAYTNVDGAEKEPDRAMAINAHGAEAVARAVSDAGAALIHVSTDYVFDGAKAAPYTEEDATAPLGAYGASKLEGERRVRAAHPGALIVRTAWVFDARGANFVRAMLRLAKSRPRVDVVRDQIGNPTYAPDLAQALLSIAAARRENGGLYHCAGEGEVARDDLAREVFSLAAQRGGPATEVTSILSRDFPTPAERPLNSRLDCGKLKRDYNIALRPWREALAACMDEIAAGGWRVE